MRHNSRIQCYSQALLLIVGLSAQASHALIFRTELGPDQLEGLIDFEIAYGIRWRVQDRDPELIGSGNGGERLTSANYDDGNLNYDVGKPVANMTRATGELTLKWGHFGAYVRGYAFYDFVNEGQGQDRARTELGEKAMEQVGSHMGILDAYLSARFEISGMPTQLRLGQQVVNWGESRFFPLDGVNVANPLNLPLAQQPTGQGKDLRLPVGMLWGSLQISPLVAIEGYYQYEWTETVLPAVGTYLSSVDPAAPDGYYFQSGPFSDQGTDVDAALGLPPGTEGFDPYFYQGFRTNDNNPSDQGQFGLSLQMLSPKLNDTKFVLMFANYHSKVPFVNAIAPATEDYLAYSVQGITAQAMEYTAQGIAPQRAADTAAVVQLNQFLNGIRYQLDYPENIPMVGFSFNTTSLRTGTAFFGEIGHHFNAPVPIASNQVFDQALPNSTPTNLFPPVDLREISPQEITANYALNDIDLIENFDKTFFSLGATQLFGPRLGASQALLTAEFGWLHIWNLPDNDERLYAAPGLAITQLTPLSAYADANSWGYRLAGALSYTNVLGGMTLSPRFGFSHDVGGNSPSGVGSFGEEKKSFTIALGCHYLQGTQLDIGYTAYWGGEEWNLINDRDFINFNIRHYF